MLVKIFSYIFNLLICNNKKIATNLIEIFGTKGSIITYSSTEKQMIEKCTDAIFFLDEAACPGSIAEMIYANTLQKKIHIFYVRNADGEETESSLHTPCWYPILFCQMTNSRVTLYSCASQEDAKRQIVELVKCGLL